MSGGNVKVQVVGRHDASATLRLGSSFPCDFAEFLLLLENCSSPVPGVRMRCVVHGAPLCVL